MSAKPPNLDIRDALGTALMHAQHLLLCWLPSLQEEQQAAADACGKVAEHEQAFWQMAFEG